MFQYQDDSRRRPGMLRPGHLVVLIGLGLYLWMSRNRFREEPVPSLGETTSLKSVAIGELENLEFERADLGFRRLAELAPQERLPLQNLVVARLLAIHPEYRRPHKDQDGVFRAYDAAEKAVFVLVEKFPGIADVRVLAARYAAQESINDKARALEELRLAAEAKPRDAAIHFEAYSVAKELPEQIEVARASLKKCWEFAPSNLFVMTELLMNQAEARDASIKDTFVTAKKQLEPFVERVENNARLNLNEHLDKALSVLEAASGTEDETSWNQIRGAMAILGNVLRPEVAWQLDRKRVNRHLLDFVLHDFSLTFETKKDTAPSPASAPAIPVKLTAPRSLPGAKEIRAVRLADFNADGSMDVVIAEDRRLLVLSRSNKEPGQDADWKELVSVELPSGTRGFALFDVDRDRAPLVGFTDSKGGDCYDSRLDVLVWGESGLSLWLNQGDETGTRLVPVADNKRSFAEIKDVLTALPVDFDHDGDLDVIVSAKTGLSLWINRDDTSFADVTRFSVDLPQQAEIHSMIAVDWNRNVSIDVLCLGNGVAGYLENLLHGQMRWQSFPTDTGGFKTARALALADSDGNFSWDVIVGGPRAVLYDRTMNPDAGVSRFTGQHEIAEHGASGLTTCDYDNDGLLDVLATDGETVKVLRGGEGGVFEAAKDLAIKADAAIRAVDADDIDGDGDQDIVIATEKSLSVVINEGGHANGSIRLPIRGEDDKDPQRRSERVNMHGIGSLIEMRVGLTYLPQVVTRQWTHFGLGANKQADTVRILWTNGVPDQMLGSKPGEAMCLQQRLKGSCPYLYAWDGEKTAFVTDCLWAAPIGLQLAEGVVAPCRDWEYLKIDGDKLVAKDGEYLLSLTEELWEIGYFDSVKLLAVDHPADVDVFSNEKVGPPSISEFKLHPVRTRHRPVRAVDQKGRDVLSQIAQRDESYLRAWDKRHKQGYTEPHFMELDLGKLADPREVKLFLTGWIRPTDTSLNIAISQRPDLEPTSPPSVWIPDASGEWRQVTPFMGFPGGKTKTIVVDLTGLFPAKDYRVRIATTMEIAWDDVFFTVDEAPVEARLTEQPLHSAELRYRGFSRMIPHPSHGPDRYDYSTLAPLMQWPPMEGQFTPYGDVLGLVRAEDNQQVTVGAGEELQLRFKVTTADVPSGWKRDFILHNVGWDKDADLNTVFGQTVEPLPFVGMKSYPDPEGPRENAPFANQTRVQDRARFWRALAPKRR